MWAIVGLFFWIPTLLRASVWFSASLLIAAVTDTPTTESARALDAAAVSYINGFRRILEALRTMYGASVEPRAGAYPGMAALGVLSAGGCLRLCNLVRNSDGHILFRRLFGLPRRGLHAHCFIFGPPQRPRVSLNGPGTHLSFEADCARNCSRPRLLAILDVILHGDHSILVAAVDPRHWSKEQVLQTVERILPRPDSQPRPRSSEPGERCDEHSFRDPRHTR